MNTFDFSTKAVLWDLDDTLYSRKEAARQMFPGMFRQCLYTDRTREFIQEAVDYMAAYNSVELRDDCIVAISTIKMHLTQEQKEEVLELLNLCEIIQNGLQKGEIISSGLQKMVSDLHEKCVSCLSYKLKVLFVALSALRYSSISSVQLTS